MPVRWHTEPAICSELERAAAANADQASEGDGSDGQSDNSQEGENTDETTAPADDQGQS